MSEVGGPTGPSTVNTVTQTEDVTAPQDVGTDKHVPKLKHFISQQLAQRIVDHGKDTHLSMQELREAIRDAREERKAERKEHRHEKKSDRAKKHMKHFRPKLYRQHMLLVELRKNLDSMKADVAADDPTGDSETWGEALRLKMSARHSDQRAQQIQKVEQNVQETEQEIAKKEKGRKRFRDIDWS